MALFTIADLHLSTTTNKPMDIFGHAWTNHAERLKTAWNELVKPEDTVVVPGDISWGMNLDEAVEDFKFINSLPGRKLIGKGNHDYWWNTFSKLNRFKEENGLDTIEFLFNNAFEADGKIICGTRGWFPDNEYTADDEKIVLREAGRLKLSVEAGLKLRKNDEELVVFLHYPPAFASTSCSPLLEVLKEYGIKRLYYGHLHGANEALLIKSVGRTDLHLISADYLRFVPKLID